MPRLATRQGLQLPANHQTRRSGDIGFGDSFRWMEKNGFAIKNVDLIGIATGSDCWFGFETP